MLAAHGARIRRVALGIGGVVALDVAGQNLTASWAWDEDEGRVVRSLLSSAWGRVWPEGEALEQLSAILAAEKDYTQRNTHCSERGLSEAVREAVGHSVQCAESKISGGGDGLFASGSIPKGRVISMYAGMWFSPWSAILYACARTLGLNYGEDGYTLCQPDFSLMDGVTHTVLQQRSRSGYVTPSACAQIANHPPAGQMPNASFFSIHVPPTAAFATMPVFPCLSTHAGCQSRVCTLLVSLVDIEDGEEVFVDYSFCEDSDGDPAWYSPTQGSQRRARGGPSMTDYMKQAEEW
eukprot:TRINITY_DN112838_c0_g1_i1.p1 TRINITY_DN112838_c0_g1~~TRINITY_DN112838_c0_g1_i1.p1  ORF type:complete len:294 (+),score=36.13 TRINITY_DN112838_c0_g1_i1:53-934(+)